MKICTKCMRLFWGRLTAGRFKHVWYYVSVIKSQVLAQLNNCSTEWETVPNMFNVM